MSASNVDQQEYCDDCGSDDVPVCRHCTAAQCFDLDAALRRRLYLYNDDCDCDCDDAVSSAECSDYMSMTGSGASSTTLPPGLLTDRMADLSVSSGASFCLYDLDDGDDDDRCSISTLENVESVEDENTRTTPPLRPSVTNSTDEQDVEFNFLTRSTSSTVCRSASLKSTLGSTAPCSPRTKKVVRFADALGLDLESIRHILDVNDMVTTSNFNYSDGPAISTKVRAKTTMKLVARFSEPGSTVNFLRRVQERKVSLEEVSVDAERRTVSGVIRVANIAYHKQVTVRCSVDNWQTYQDHTATYLPPGGANTRYDGGLTDAFTFQLHLPSALAVGGRLEFSVRFAVGQDLTFWDSNFGSNYAVDCVPVSTM